MSLSTLLGFFLHLDTHLASLAEHGGVWIYLLLFLVVFFETGLVLTPFLPGDSLLFAAGALASGGGLRVEVLLFLIFVAAVSGDTVNYWVGFYFGNWMLKKVPERFFQRKHFERSQHFYEKHGAKTIVLARFIPIVRTFAPFVAGFGKMAYGRFVAYNVGGGALWVLLFVGGGYLFGNLPGVKKNFSLVILAIIIVSLVPVAVEFFRQRRESTRG